MPLIYIHPGKENLLEDQTKSRRKNYDTIWREFF